MNNYTAYSWLDAVQVQRFDRLYDATPSATLTLGAALDAIVDGVYADAITTLSTAVKTAWVYGGFANH